MDVNLFLIFRNLFACQGGGLSVIFFTTLARRYLNMRSKKFLVGTIIPVLGLASVIGAGFSTFVFGDTTATNKYDLTVELEDYASIGSFSVSGSMKLVLDQTPGALSSINPQGQGAHLEISELKITYTPTPSHGVKNKDMAFTYTLSMGGLNDVVTITAGDSGEIPWDTPAAADTNDLTWTVEDTDFTIAYAGSAEPTDVSSWESLSSKVAGLTEENKPSLKVDAALNIKA